MERRTAIETLAGAMVGILFPGKPGEGVKNIRSGAATFDELMTKFYALAERVETVLQDLGEGKRGFQVEIKLKLTRKETIK